MTDTPSVRERHVVDVDLMDASHGGKGRMLGCGQAGSLAAPVREAVRLLTRSILHPATVAEAVSHVASAPMYHV